MTPDIVVDIGNSRMKWGRRSSEDFESVSLLYDEVGTWKQQLEQWSGERKNWAIASVVPEQLGRLTKWLTQFDVKVTLIENELFLKNVAADGFSTSVRNPQSIGIDRLVCAAYASKLKSEDYSVIVVNIGTAMTFDFVHESGEHVGGLILPGPRLMAESLRSQTAALPEVEITPEWPNTWIGKNTYDAIVLGIKSAVIGTAYSVCDDWLLNHPNTTVKITGWFSQIFDRPGLTRSLEIAVIDPMLNLRSIEYACQVVTR